MSRQIFIFAEFWKFKGKRKYRTRYLASLTMRDKLTNYILRNKLILKQKNDVVGDLELHHCTSEKRFILWKRRQMPLFLAGTFRTWLTDLGFIFIFSYAYVLNKKHHLDNFLYRLSISHKISTTMLTIKRGSFLEPSLVTVSHAKWICNRCLCFAVNQEYDFLVILI